MVALGQGALERHEGLVDHGESLFRAPALVERLRHDGAHRDDPRVLGGNGLQSDREDLLRRNGLQCALAQRTKEMRLLNQFFSR